MMLDIIEKMNEIILKNKKKKKLNSEEGLKVQTYLEQLLKDPQYREKGYGFMLSLPADISGNIFLKVWLESEETVREALVNELINYKDFTGEAAYNRLIELCKLFTTAALQPVSFKFLIALSEKMTSTGTSMPADKYVTKFRNSLMNGNGLLKIPIGNYNVTPREITSVATLILYGLLSSEWNDPKQDTEWKRLYMDWLGQCRSIPLLPLLADIEKESAKWPEELQRQGVEKGLFKTVTTRLLDRKSKDILSLQPDNNRHGEQRAGIKNPQPAFTQNTELVKGEMEKQEEPVDSDKKPHSDRTEKKTENRTVYREDFNAFVYLERLGQYITKIKKQLQKTESELIDARLEADRERKKRALSETKLAEVEKGLQVANFKIQNLQSELTNSHEKAAKLSTQFEEMKKKHESEITDLLEMIDTRSAQAVQQLKNRLIQSLRTDYQDFRQIDKDPMTVELGENLRAQLDNIFQRLAEEEIKFGQGV